MQWAAIIAIATKVLDWLKDHNISLDDIWPRIEAWLGKELGGGVSPPAPPPVITPPPPVDPVETNEPDFRGIMATDWGCTSDLASAYRQHASHWRDVGINTIYTVCDIQTGGGAQSARPHCAPGRLPDRPTDLLVKNLKLIRSWGFRVIVVGGNEPSVRSGGAAALGAHGGQNVGTGDLYTPAKLGLEKEFYRRLLASFVPEAIVLYLEPSHESAVWFQAQLASWLRAYGYRGWIFSNGYGDGAWYTRNGDRVRWAPSQNSVPLGGQYDLANCDGMMTLGPSTAASYVPQIINAAGADGWILWADDYRGKGGPSAWPDWLAAGIARA